MKNMIKLKDALQYYSAGDKLQVIFDGDGKDWDDAVEIRADSRLLEPFANWLISCAGVIVNEDDEGLIRYSLKSPQEITENKGDA